MPIKAILTGKSRISQTISLNLHANLCHMYDLDKLIRKNNVADERGLNLVCELCDGKWNDFKTNTLLKEVFDNMQYDERLNEVAGKYIDDKEEIKNVLREFRLYLGNPDIMEKLKQPILDGCSFVDALCTLFEKDYLHPADMDKTLFEKPIRDMKKLISRLFHEHNVDRYICEKCNLDEKADVNMFYSHYCDLLNKYEGKPLGGIWEKDLRGAAFVKMLIRHFETEYVSKGLALMSKDDRTLFFRLYDNEAERDAYLWKNREEYFEKILVGKLKPLFASLSDTIEIGGVVSALMDRFESHLTGRNGKLLIQEFVFERRGNFEEWSLRLVEDCINKEYESFLKVHLSVKTLEKNIFMKSNYSEFSIKISELFNKIRFDRYVRKEWQLDENMEIDPICRHYCRLLINDRMRGLKVTIEEEEKHVKSKGIAIVTGLVRFFREDYIRKMKEQMSCRQDKAHLYNLLTDQAERDKLLWYSRHSDYEQDVREYISHVFLILGLDEADVEGVSAPLMERLESFFTKNSGLWKFLENYSFEKDIDEWSAEMSKVLASKMCRQYVGKIIGKKLRDFYLLNEEDARGRFLRMKQLASRYILADELDGGIRKNWGEEIVDTSMVYEHYFYTLVNGSRQSFKNVWKGLTVDDDRKMDIEEALKESFMNDFKDYLNAGREQMSVGKNRELFFRLLKYGSERDRFLWEDNGREYDQKIEDEVRSAYMHLIYTTPTDDPKRLLAQNSRILEAAKKIKADLASFLTGEGGWAFVRNYSFDKRIDAWRDFVINNFIEARPRIDLFIGARDKAVLHFYILNEFGKDFVSIYNDFTRLGSSSVEYREKGVYSESGKNANRKRKVVDVIEISDEVIQDFVVYFYMRKPEESAVSPDGSVENASSVWGCDNQFKHFRYESKLSSFMHEICKNYFLRLINKEFKEERKSKKKHSMADKNPRIPNKDDAVLKNCGLKPGQKLGTVKKKDEVPDLNVLINAVLVDYAWLFFDFRKDEFAFTAEMHDSFQQIADEGGNWKFFADPIIVTFGIPDIKEIKGVKDKDVKVLPKLVAFSHIQYVRCYNEKGEKAKRNKEKTSYRTLTSFYKAKEGELRIWKKRGKDEFNEKVRPLFGVFNRAIELVYAKSEGDGLSEEDFWEIERLFRIRDGIPMFLKQISKLFLPASMEVSRYLSKPIDEKIVRKRESLQINKTNLSKSSEQETDGKILANRLISGMSPNGLAAYLENCLWDMNQNQKDARNAKNTQSKK